MNDGIKASLEILLDMIPATAAYASAAKSGAKLSLAAVSDLVSRQQQEGLEEFLSYLGENVGDLQQFFSDPWLKSEHGSKFWHKVLGSAMDAQLADKRQIFANVLVNGVSAKDYTDKKKLRMLDMLRSLSLASLECLAEIHVQYADRLGSLDLESKKSQAFPLSDVKLSTAGDTFYTESLLQELVATGALSARPNANPRDGRQALLDLDTTEAAYYTEFSLDFAEFISTPDREQLVTH